MPTVEQRVPLAVEHVAQTPHAGPVADVLSATGIEKSYRRGVWPVRRRQQVLRGATLTLRAGEVVIANPVGVSRHGRDELDRHERNKCRGERAVPRKVREEGQRRPLTRPVGSDHIEVTECSLRNRNSE